MSQAGTGLCRWFKEVPELGAQDSPKAAWEGIEFPLAVNLTASDVEEPYPDAQLQEYNRFTEGRTLLLTKEFFALTSRDFSPQAKAVNPNNVLIGRMKAFQTEVQPMKPVLDPTRFIFI